MWIAWSALERPRPKPAPAAAEPQVPADNVLPFPRRRPKKRRRSRPVERNAFQELGRELSDRLKKTAVPGDTAQVSDDFGAKPAAPAAAPPRVARKGNPPAMPTKAARFSTACRSAFWSIASTA